MASKSYALFGSQVELVLPDAEGDAAEAVMDEAYALGLRLQRIFNIYDSESELSRLNRERAITASPELLDVLRRALDLCRRSDGAYDITHGMRFLARKRGEPLPIVAATWRDIAIEGDRVTLALDDAWVDLGSVAKGYIADRMAAYLADQGAESGYVDARGDIKLFGAETSMGVKHPRADGLICTIRVADKAVATSGDYSQFRESYDESHILSKKEIISATVVAGDLADADALATILMVSDAATRARLLHNTGIQAMTIDNDMQITYYNGFERMVVA